MKKFFSVVAFAMAIATAVAKGEGDLIPGNAQWKYCKDKEYPILLSIFAIDKKNDTTWQKQNVTVTMIGKSKDPITREHFMWGEIRQPAFGVTDLNKTDPIFLCDLPTMNCPTNDVHIVYNQTIPPYPEPGNWKVTLKILKKKATQPKQLRWAMVDMKKKKPKQQQNETLTCVTGHLKTARSNGEVPA